MWIVRNNIIPFGGYKAINLFGILFCKKDANIDAITINHEEIHTAQMIEMLFIPFYIWYGIEYLIKLIKYGSAHKAYRNLCFEREAYQYEDDSTYLKNRKHYNWIHFI
jgi:hypothetical protein